MDMSRFVRDIQRLEINDGDTLLVKFNKFGDDNAKEIIKAMKAFEKELVEVGFTGVKVLIIDSTTDIAVVQQNMQAQIARATPIENQDLLRQMRMKELKTRHVRKSKER